MKIATNDEDKVVWMYDGKEDEPGVSFDEKYEVDEVPPLDPDGNERGVRYYNGSEFTIEYVPRVSIDVAITPTPVERGDDLFVTVDSDIAEFVGSIAVGSDVREFQTESGEYSVKFDMTTAKDKVEVVVDVDGATVQENTVEIID